jgi:hypothetical protein
MHLEIVQALRCPAPHERAWLVARTDRLDARHIVQGALGCPVCSAEYAVREGVAEFGPAAGASDGGPGLGADAAIRAAAWLGLTTPGGLVVLAGAWAAAAVDVAALAEGVHVLAVNAPADPPPLGLGVSVAHSAGMQLLGDGVARGVALDGAHAAPDDVRAAAEALAAGGRLLAPVASAVPPQVAELARDERWWVAERRAAAPVVPLTVARRAEDR